MLIEYVNTAFPKIQLENYKTMTSPNERMLLILYAHISNYFCYKVFTLDIWSMHIFFLIGFQIRQGFQYKRDM